VRRTRPLLRLRPGLAALIGSGLLALTAAACGGEIQVDDQKDESAAVIFEEHCSGCHSLKAANAYGSKPEGQIPGGERTNGPNFNVRKVSRDDALYAIRNGGFSGAIMPANVIVGRNAQAVADFLAKYSGKESDEQSDVVAPGQGTGSGGG
jgi:mono/diheme cytochrome c family protein